MRVARLVSASTWIGLAVLLAVIVAVYWPGLRGPFVFDDHPNIVNNPAVAIDALEYIQLLDASLSKEIRILTRPAATLSFAINYYFAEGFDDTFWFKLTNLAIHLTNTLLIFWLSRLLLGNFETQRTIAVTRNKSSSRWIPLLVAAVWTLHPLNLSTVLYVVQRMTSLATLFMLLGSIFFIYGRNCIEKEPRRGMMLMTGGAVAGIGLGLLGKEIALLLPLYLFAIDATLLRHPSRGMPELVRRFHLTSLSIVALGAAYYLMSHSDRVFGIYSLREFTLGERLLTEPRILWFYLSLLVFPAPGRFSLFHDDIGHSTGLLSPLSTLPAICGTLVAFAFAIAYRKRFPLIAFAILWFMFGHAMESTIIGLELAHEHRNYLPSFGPLFALTYAAAVALQRMTRPLIATLAALLTCATLAYSTSVLASYWSSEETLSAYLAKNHPRSARAQVMLAELALKSGNPLRAIDQYKLAADLAPNETSFLLRAVNIAAVAEVHGDVLNLSPYLSVKKDRDGTYLSSSPEMMADVAQRLTFRPVHSRTVEALGTIRGCVEDDPQHCGRLRETVLRWHDLALRNERTNNNMRRTLYFGLASLQVSSGKYDAALQSVRKARTYNENAPTLILMEANILYLLGETAHAKDLLEILNTNPALDDVDREQVEKLGAMLRTSRR